MPQLSRHTSTSLSDINIVPFVDVMLVLLVIFMITAPILQSAERSDLSALRQNCSLRLVRAGGRHHAPIRHPKYQRGHGAARRYSALKPPCLIAPPIPAQTV